MRLAGGGKGKQVDMGIKNYLAVTVLSLALCVAGAGVSAQNTSSSAPLEISADETLEWHRDAHKYVARGAVVARQGDVTIYADMMQADYRVGAKSSTDIYRLTATGNVRILSDGNEAQGDHAVYELDRGLATMTGDHLRMSGPDQVVTARDRFEYFTEKGRLNAIGAASAVREGNRINADRLSAIFAQKSDATAPAQNNLAGNRKLERLEADGNVVITTPTEILTGARGFYRADNNSAEIMDNVVIRRGPNSLTGARATVDLNTNISRMFGAETGPAQAGDVGAGDGRVRGVFYPGSEEKAP